eukprot:m.483707 g.483707  ORF g.483707 m.483707 type:complete len:360 (+) comp23050_c0_seq1:162-1241(+)
MLRFAPQALRSAAALAGRRQAPQLHRAAPALAVAHGRTAQFSTTRDAQLYNSGREPLPRNTGINFVPQQQAWVVERFGKFFQTLEPGLRFLIPFVDHIAYVHSLKELVVEIPSQSGITQDNVTLHIDGVLYIKITDPYKASYGVEDPKFAVAQLAQTTMRSELGKLPLDTVFKERQTLNTHIVDAINEAATPWGLSCLRCEIRDIMLPDKVVEDMQRQVSAERKKRASILESEGARASQINVAEGTKRSVVLNSEASMVEQENEARGEAQAILARAKATKQAIEMVAEAVQRPGGQEAVALQVATQYVEAFGNLAKESNTVLLPSNPGDPAAMVAQALSVFQNVKTAVPATSATPANSQ